MGLRTSPMGEVFFEDCEVPEENLLGKEGAGSWMFTRSMTWERRSVLAAHVGTMQRLLETCIRYANQRKQCGQSIGEYQQVATKIVEMKMRVERSRLALLQLRLGHEPSQSRLHGSGPREAAMYWGKSSSIASIASR